jgi:hypothetical protein
LGYNAYIHKNVTSNKDVIFFSFDQNGEQEGRTGPACRGWYKWEEQMWKRIWEGEYSESTMYMYVNGK